MKERLLGAGEINHHDSYRYRGVKGWLRRVLPTSVYDYVRWLRIRFRHTAIGSRLKLVNAGYYEFLASSGILSGLFYAVWNRSFDREHKALLSARAKFFRDVFRNEGSIYLLRRNVHRIEKGLIMKPRRDVFGVSYLPETMRCYVDCVKRHANGELHDVDTLNWSKQVLGTYLDQQKAHPIVDKFRKVYETIQFENAQDQLQRVPFERNKTPEIPNFESLMNLAVHRRSVRWFEQRPVPREVIDRAVVLAGLSPSACNRQPYHFAVYDDPMLCQEIGGIPKGTPGWLHNIPCFIVIVGTLEAFDREKDRHVPYIDGSLAAMALCFGLEVQGVSTCCVNWPDLADTEARMAKRLGLKKHERPIMCLAVGYPDYSAKVPYSQKLPLSELRSYNAAPLRSIERKGTGNC